jgi:hypothetical protein
VLQSIFPLEWTAYLGILIAPTVSKLNQVIGAVIGVTNSKHKFFKRFLKFAFLFWFWMYIDSYCEGPNLLTV